MKKSIWIFILFVFQACGDRNHQSFSSSVPRIQGESASENYFGISVTDDYRNFEDTTDTLINQWYTDQTKLANSILNRISGRDDLINQLYEVSKRESFDIKKVNITSNNRCFFLMKKVEESYYRLYFKETLSSESITLLDPKDLKINNRKDYVINYIKPSWNGKYVVVSITYSGRDLSDLIILDVDNETILPQVLNNAWPSSFLGVNWLPDNSGFTYLKFLDTNIANPNFKQNSQSVLHLLKDGDGKTNYIFGNKTQPELNIDKKLYPTTKIHSDNDKYIIGYLSGVDSYWDAYYTNISDLKSGNFVWKPLYKKKDKVHTQKGYFVKEDFVFLTAKEADNKMIKSFNLRELSSKEPRVVVKEKDSEVISDFKITKDALFYTTLKYGVDASLYKVVNGVEEKLKTPKKAGWIGLSNKSVYSNNLWVSIEGWTSPNLRYSYDNKTNTFKENSLYPKVNYSEFDNIIAEEVLVKSDDGTQIPLSIVRNKSIKRNGSSPVFLYGYGAYGDIESPYFSSIMLSFVKKGGLFCIAHVRGGGEKGDTWHKGGFKTTKPNSWKDLITCAEYLTSENLSSKDKIALYGASAGGLLVTRAMIDRPDLFQVVISEYGYLNPFRSEVLGSAGSNTEEFGSIKDSVECISLINMDPYLNLKSNTNYPALYFTVGMNDPQVQPWMSGKFIAKVLRNESQQNPIFLIADYEAGHGDTSDELKIYKEWANIFAFIFWQTGHPDFVLK